ncbi:hypothetical protein ACA910_011470 [Epithemia clementina (nom. ined.)]
MDYLHHSPSAASASKATPSSTPMDDGSISSTIETCPAPKVTVALDSRRSRHHRVSFQEATNVSYVSPFTDKLETKHLWYSASDYQQFKTLYTEALKTVILEERNDQTKRLSFIRVLERIYDNCCNSSMNSNNNSDPHCYLDSNHGDDDHDEYDQEMEDFLQQRLRHLLLCNMEPQKQARRRRRCRPQEQQQQQQQQQQQDQQQAAQVQGEGDEVDRVGLEKSVVRRVRLEKKWRRKELLNAIFQIQNDDEEEEDYERSAMTIALVARDISRPSRLFAQQIAMVTAQAVQ